MVEINLTMVIKYFLIFIINFLFVFYSYRYIFYPKFRWSQKGNICHDNRFYTSIFLSIILIILEFFIYNKIFVFTF